MPARQPDDSYYDPDDSYVRRLADVSPGDEVPSLEEWRRMHALAVASHGSCSTCGGVEELEAGQPCPDCCPVAYAEYLAASRR